MDVIYYHPEVKINKGIIRGWVNQYGIKDYILFVGKRDKNEVKSIKLSDPYLIIDLDIHPYLFNGQINKKERFYASLEIIANKVVPILYMEEKEEANFILNLASYLKPRRIFYISKVDGVYEGDKLVKKINKEEIKKIQDPLIKKLIDYTDEIYFGKTKIAYY